jgi:hypothetical protein
MLRVLVDPLLAPTGEAPPGLAPCVAAEAEVLRLGSPVRDAVL